MLVSVSGGVRPCGGAGGVCMGDKACVCGRSEFRFALLLIGLVRWLVDGLEGEQDVIGVVRM